MEWKEDIAADFCSSVTDGTHDSPKATINGKKLITSKHLKDGYIDFESAKFISEKDYLKVIERSKVDQFDILFSMIGTIGNIYRETSPNIEYAVKNMGIFKMGGNAIRSKWLYYWLKSKEAHAYIYERMAGSTQSYLTLDSLRKFPVVYPEDINDMENIVSILSSLDRKIELNNKINADLEEMAQAIFKNWFVDFEPFKDGKFVDSELGMIPEGWKVGRADDFYQINIGKTPPRKEHKWFSTNPADKIWVSIANMGNSGIFISDSSEYLTKEAVDRHNIIMVPRNTILLSFKLTVGRVAIADKELTTNEAIARFILSDDKYMEYLYLYLKNFDYNSLGSTSSIATAVNSKTIKGIQMLQPSDKIIDAFHIQVNPIFEKIRSLTKENSRLSLLRDTLLPRLMSGELEVPE